MPGLLGFMAHPSVDQLFGVRPRGWLTMQQPVSRLPHIWACRGTEAAWCNKGQPLFLRKRDLDRGSTRCTSYRAIHAAGASSGGTMQTTPEPAQPSSTPARDEVKASWPLAEQQGQEAATQKALNAQLCAATSVQGVLGVLASVRSMEELGDVNAITAFHRLAKHAARGGEAGGVVAAKGALLRSPLLPKLVAHLERPSMQWSAMGLASVLWAHAVLGHGSKALVNKAYRQLDWLEIEDSMQCCTLLLYAMARLRRPHAMYLRRLKGALAAEAERARQVRQQRRRASSMSDSSGAPSSRGAPGAGGSPLLPSGDANVPASTGQAGAADLQAQLGYVSNGGSQVVVTDDSSSSSSNSRGREEEGGGARAGLLAGLPSQQLCLLAYSLASLGCTDGMALTACLDEIEARDLGRLSVKSLCQVTRGLAGAGVYHGGACDSIAAAVAKLPEAALDGETCSRLVHDYATIYQKHLVDQGHNPTRRLHWQAAVREFVRQGPARCGMLLRVAQHAQQEVGRMGSVSISSLVWGLATLGQREGPLLDALAERAQQLGTELDAQAVASICWAFSALGHDHPRMMEAMAGTALALLSDPARRQEFNAQTVPMLALSYAVANRCELPSVPSMMAALAGRAEEVLPELTPQGLSNLGWALAVARTFPPALLPAWRGAVGQVLPLCGPLELNQLHQVQAALRLDSATAAVPAPEREQAELGGPSGAALSSFDSLFEVLYQRGRLRNVSQRGWEREKRWGDRTVTRFQKKVHAMLGALGMPCELEHTGAGGEYSVDIAILSERIAVECDGPSHFMANSRHVGGATALKHRLLRQLGWRVVAIPYFDWPNDSQEQMHYLVRRLEAAGLKVDAQQAAAAARQGNQLRRRQTTQPAAADQPLSAAARRPLGYSAAGSGSERAAGAAEECTAHTSPVPGGPHDSHPGDPRSSESGLSGGSTSCSDAAVAHGAGGEVKDSGGEPSPSVERPTQRGPGTSQAESAAGPAAVGDRAQRLAVMQFKSGKLSRTGLLARKARIDAEAKRGTPPGGGGGGLQAAP